MSNLIGQSLGRYHILEQLGEGGMAIVYKAYDTRLERDVAVKVIRTEKLTIETMGKTLKRFEREAKALAKLTHPNIVPITDYGEHDGKPYLVMPYLPGGTLKQKLGKPIPWEDSVRLLIPIARALHYAHQQGIIHRDVKPSNILITQSGEPMLTDFGIAKILLDNEETADLTGTGMGVGTPEYMSPEQFQGKGVDARTDVYSLGVVLYEMITGRKPYQADTPAAVLIKQATEPLPRPRSFVPELSDAVEKILLKALAKEKENRYENMAGLVNVLERLLSTHPTLVNDESKKLTEKAHIANKPLPVARRDAFQPATIQEATLHSPLSIANAESKNNHAQEIRRLQKRGGWIRILVITIGIVVISLAVLSLTNIVNQSGSVISTRTATAVATTIQPFPTKQVQTDFTATAQAQMEITANAQGTAAVMTRMIRPDNINRLTILQTMEHSSIYYIECLAFSPDSKILASGVYGNGGDSTIRLWRVSDRTLLRTLEGHSSGLLSLAFSPDGLILASGSYDNTVRLWRVSDGTALNKLLGHTGDVVFVAFSLDGRTLMSGSNDETVKLWDSSNGTLLQTMNMKTDRLDGIGFSQNTGILAISGGAGLRSLRLWQVTDTSITLLRSLEETYTQRWRNNLKFSPDGNILASSVNGGIQLLRVSDGAILGILNTEDGTSELGFSPNGKILASGSYGTSIYFWSVSDGIHLHTLDISDNSKKNNYIHSIAFSPDGTMLAAASGNTIYLLGIAP